VLVFEQVLSNMMLAVADPEPEFGVLGEREPIKGVWGKRAPRAEPLVKGSEAKPPEAERFLGRTT